MLYTFYCSIYTITFIIFENGLEILIRPQVTGHFNFFCIQVSRGNR